MHVHVCMQLLHTHKHVFGWQGCSEWIMGVKAVPTALLWFDVGTGYHHMWVAVSCSDAPSVQVFPT